MRKPYQICLSMLLVCLVPAVASAQSFRVQCPTSTITHPTAANNNSEPAYVGPTYAGTAGYPAAPAHVNGAIKCQQISGGDGYASMGDGTQTYLFSFGPLSGLADIAAGLPGTQFPRVFNTLYSGAPLQPGAPDGSGGSYNGAVGQVPDADNGNPFTVHVAPRPTTNVVVITA